MMEGVQIVDRQWRYIYLNRAALTHGKQDKENLLNRKMQDCFPGIENTLMFRSLERTMADGVSRRLENQFEYPDGSCGWFELYIEGHEEGILIRSLDVTDRKNLEIQLLHAQKMQAVGLLASGVAHEFNNYLSVLRLNCDLLVDCLEDDRARERLSRISQAIENSTKLTQQLLTLSHRQPKNVIRLNLNSVIESSIYEVKNLFGPNVEVCCHLGDKLNDVWVDQSQLDQVLLNLAINAKDAMPDGGTLSFSTQNVEVDEEMGARFDLNPGCYVKLSVSDTGHGISEQAQERIFDPFFTTKSRGKGSGLGLSTVHSIIKHHQGRITVNSRPDCGATFEIWLPCFGEGERMWSTNDCAEYEDLRGSANVLVVEDDELVSMSVAETLRDFGYTVKVVFNPKDAIEVFRSSADTIDLVISDYIMPEMNGHELAEKLMSINPLVKLFFISGIVESYTAHRALIDAGFALLPKPFSSKHLLEMTCQILSEKK